ncbi:hypothetical protein B0H13DRAFT_2676701 [Mycena leptocephala]|nr:hypothetical protein B0H13DRAFT_2676701 [Mycena leptocephala]
MSSGLHRPAQYVHYTGPVQAHNQGQQNVGHGQQQQPTTVSPQDTQHAPPKTHTSTHTHASNLTATVPRAAAAAHNAGTSAASTSNNNTGAQGQGQAPAPQPVVAKGNWTKDLVQLAKTAELKLESERQRLIECLAQVNEDRNQADLLEATLDRERGALRAKIGALSEGEYKAAKNVIFFLLVDFTLADADVDRLRADLGQPPLPTLQETLDGKGAGLDFVLSLFLHTRAHTSLGWGRCGVAFGFLPDYLRLV